MGTDEKQIECWICFSSVIFVCFPGVWYPHDGVTLSGIRQIEKQTSSLPRESAITAEISGKKQV